MCGCVNTLVCADNSTVARLKVFRIIRLLRLIKLLRILRASRLMRRLRARVSVSDAIIRLSMFGCLVVFVAHWIACLWAIGATLAEPPNWQTQYAGFQEEPTVFALYVASLYWCVRAHARRAVPRRVGNRWYAVIRGRPPRAAGA